MSTFNSEESKRERRFPSNFAASGDRRRLPIPWLLINSLGALFLLCWLAPPLAFLKVSTSLMPTPVHTMLELAAVVIAVLTFAVAWHAYDARRPANILILGCGLLCVALVDVGHLLSYPDMPSFVTPSGTEKSIAFWISARLIAALTLLVVAARTWKPMRNRAPRLALLGTALVLAALAWSLDLAHAELWPRTFIEGQGLTGFKIALEYAIIALLLLPAFLLYRQSAYVVQPYDTHGLFTAVAISILSELCFTLYANVNEVFSLLGHAYKVLAYLFIYRAVFLVSVREPFVLLRGEVAERRAAEEEIRHRVYHDPVTGLPNRLMLEEQLRALLERGEPAMLMSIDVDHFKPINDAVGVTLGDQLLRQVGERLERGCGKRGLVARSAADSFLLLLQGAQGQAQIREVLADLDSEMRQPCHLADMDFPLTVSIGIAAAPRDGRDFENLKHNADTAMARAKQLGRNHARFFDFEMDARERERRRMFGWLREGLDQKQFQLYYQPQLDLASGRVTGIEALLRWNHPQMGLILPDRFIGVAEDTGLINALGDWVLHEACRQMAQWQHDGWGKLTIAVNVSPVQFRQPQLDASVEAALASAGLPASMLELEVTEGVLMDDSERVLSTVRNLHAKGVRLAIDDFGTGYSSLAYLKRFAVSRLKIDRSFIQELRHSRDDASIVQAVIQIAHNLNLELVAEGVTDEATRELLVKMGCEEGQGYLFCRPLPAAEVPGWLAASRTVAEQR